ncbi:hypothetical protein GCM10011391_14830 [Pullulanibacillus camelliae]|uniref:DoxX family protein n=1 Tax=Pullulanibacillus camelliae TaxID=1707096 RepID=A0A8J2VLN5_9BACL|nr:DoxX family protein [Pullulanibacillus camelliae]GGE36967.1 hypothetical protein GCM10011391_14830 [Pullulanibacillus camelliae]
MFITFVRENKFVAYVLFIVRVYLGWEWLTSGWEKITGGFDATGFLKGATQAATGDHPSVQHWWASFLDNVVLPHAGFFNVLVPWGECLVGIGLILGVLTTFSALMAAVMNFAYLFSGTTSTNPQMLLLVLFVLIAGSHAATIGLDPWLKLKQRVRTFLHLNDKNHKKHYHALKG